LSISVGESLTVVDEGSILFRGCRRERSDCAGPADSHPAWRRENASIVGRPLIDTRKGNICRDHPSDRRVEADRRTDRSKDLSPLGRAELVNEIVDRALGPVFDLPMIRNDEAIPVVNTRSILSTNVRRDDGYEGNGQRDSRKRGCDFYGLELRHWKVLRRICAL
jgi:hypothetical protein